MGDTLREVALASGYQLNAYGGVYKSGARYSHAKKIEVAAAYINARNSNGSARPANILSIARECKVDESYVRKVEREIDAHGTILAEGERPPISDDDDEEDTEYHAASGPGSKSLNQRDILVLLQLHEAEPSRSLQSYVDNLTLQTGTVVSTSTVSRVFLHAFPHSAKLKSPSRVPIDKFKPQNLVRATEYLSYIARQDPFRLKFGDEKHLKGQEVYNRKNRVNPLTGELPPIITTPDFRNSTSLHITIAPPRRGVIPILLRRRRSVAFV